jgi:hypothetical protein
MKTSNLVMVVVVVVVGVAVITSSTICHIINKVEN